MLHQFEARGAEEGAEQADGILHDQDDSEAPEGALQDLCSPEVCGSGRDCGGMKPLGDGLPYDWQGPLRDDLDRGVFWGILLKNTGVRVAHRDGRQSNSWMLG